MTSAEKASIPSPHPTRTSPATMAAAPFTVRPWTTALRRRIAASPFTATKSPGPASTPAARRSARATSGPRAEERRCGGRRGHARDPDALAPAGLAREQRDVGALHAAHAGEEGEERRVRLAVDRRRSELDLEAAVVLAD